MASFLPPGIQGLLGLLGQPSLITLANKPPGWQTRLRPAAYTSPKKRTRIKFEYEDVSREFDLRGTAHEFPQVNDAFVQRTGFGPRRYPMTCYFSGKDHDLVASAFEAALMEEGTGVLEHPLYGTLRNVVPFGTVTRNDALATAANQSVVQVTFWTTTGAVWPSSEPNGRNEILAALGNFNVVAAQSWAIKAPAKNALAKAGLIATIKGYLKTVSGAMSAVSSSVTSIRREMQDIQDAINFGIDVLIGQPLLLAQQISNLIQAPARAIAGISSRLDGYSRLATDVFGSSGGDPALKLEAGSSLSARLEAIANDFHTADLFAANAVAGSVLATVAPPQPGAPPTFTTRRQAIAAAAAVAEQFEALVAWRDEGFEALGGAEGLSEGQVDTGESYQALQQLVAITMGYLVQASFGLQAERQIVLDRPRTIIDLAAELYGSVDDKIELLITSNDLTGDEILELPAGKAIVYYPQAA